MVLFPAAAQAPGIEPGTWGYSVGVNVCSVNGRRNEQPLRAVLALHRGLPSQNWLLWLPFTAPLSAAELEKIKSVGFTRHRYLTGRARKMANEWLYLA